MSTQDFQTWLNDHLAAANMELSSVAALANISQGYLSLLRLGQRTGPSRRTVQALAHVFGADPDQALELAGLNPEAGSGTLQRPAGRAENRFVSTIQRALTSGRLELPKQLAEVATDAVRASAAGPAGFRILSPTGLFVRSQKPTFRWESPKWASSSQVFIFNVLQPVVAITPSPKIAGSEWECSHLLQRGAIYEWQVKATSLERAALSATGRFKILEQPQAKLADHAEQRYAGLPIPLSIAYVNLGLLDEASRLLEAVPPGHLEYTVALRLLAALREGQ